LAGSSFYNTTTSVNVIGGNGDKGDITVSGGGTVLTVDPKAITFPKMQDISSGRILGRFSAGSGPIEEIVLGTNLSLTGNVLNAAGGGSGVGVTDGDKGDVTVSGTGTVWTIDNDVVTFPKMQNIATGTLLGRSTSATGDIEQISIGSGLTLAAGVLTSSGGGGGGVTDGNKGSILVESSGTVWSIVDNAATFAKVQDIPTNRLLGRFTAGTGDIETVQIGAGLSMAGGVLTATNANSLTDGNKGDITVDLTGTRWLVNANALALSRLAQVPTNTIIGRSTAGIGNLENITVGSGLALSGGVLSTTGGGGGSLADGDKGDIVVSGGGAVWSIENDSVTFAKLQNISNARLIGRFSAGGGDAEQITLGTGLALSGSGVLSATAGGSSFDPSTLTLTGATAAQLRRLSYYGMHLADFVSLSSGATYPLMGEGTGYTVNNWISDGAFPNLTVAQSFYPIIQNGDDHVDWVILQSAIDFLIYGSLGNSNRKTMKRKLIIPAGHFLINRTLHVGYGSAGTSPPNLNGNKYVSITIEGEGPQTDTSGNGMTGTSIITENYTYPGMNISAGQQVILRGFTMAGPNTGWSANNNPYRSPNNWDVAAWKNPACADLNYIEGHACNIGIGFDLYSDVESAAGYPARVLPAYFGGGTTTAGFGGVGGTDALMEDVNIVGFIMGMGRPYGDSNAEFIRFHRGRISNCTYGVMMGHSQNRNPSIVDCDISACHTAITTKGGTRGNAQMTGSYINIHVGQCYQIFDHPAADWSGPVTFRDCYAESFSKIGTWMGPVKLDGCTLSFIEQEAIDGVPSSHFTGGRLILDNTSLGGLRHGLFFDSINPNNSGAVEFLGSSAIYGTSAASNLGNLSEPALSQTGHGLSYMNSTFTPIKGTSSRVMVSHRENTMGGYGGNRNFFREERLVMTFFDQLWTEYSAAHPNSQPDPFGSNEMQGSVQNFPVPKITQWQHSVTVNSRSGFDIVCNRTGIGDLKADVGDVFGFEPTGVDPTLVCATWFICISVTTSTMTLRQLNNYQGTSRYDYNNTGYTFYQIGPGSYLTQYINTRIRSNIKLFVGDTTVGSNVITNIRHAFQFGSTDVFTADNFNTWVGMKVGDYFLHQEIDRANTGGSGLKVPNRVTGIDFTANTITLADPFNVTSKNYPIVFYVKSFTA
jgi:hypothetical protein